MTKDELYRIEDGKILTTDVVALVKDEKVAEKVKAYRALGYEVVEIEPEKAKKSKRKTFKAGKAEAYINAYDKKSLKEFQDLKANANKLAAKYSSLVAAAKAALAENATAEEKEAAPNEADIKAAQKKMITAQRDAFTKQRKFFIDKYGEEEYNAVRMM